MIFKIILKLKSLKNVFKYKKINKNALQLKKMKNI